MQPTETQVTSPTEPPVRLAVREHGDRSAGVHVLLLHGYPDDQTLWDDVVAELPAEWHVVTMDNRGAGASERPSGTAAYDVDELVEDVVAVCDATVPGGQPVHLVGHDWGAIIGWEVLAASTRDPRLERLASFTSVCGASLDHVRTVASSWRGLRRLLPQLLHSWYVLLFSVPVLPELLWRRGQWLLRPAMARLDPTAPMLRRSAAATEDGVAGLGLYRAAVRRGRAASYWRTSVPVQVVHATRDAYVTPLSTEGIEARCRDLTRASVDCGHWVPRAEPQQLAELVRRFVAPRAAGEDRPAAV